jgi:hypothetical protein
MAVMPDFHLMVHFGRAGGSFYELPLLGRAYMENVARSLSDAGGGALYVDGADFSVSTAYGAWWAMVDDGSDDVFGVVADGDAQGSESFPDPTGASPSRSSADIS